MEIIDTINDIEVLRKYSTKLKELVVIKDKKLDELQEDLEYSNHCNEELRKKITNLNYKITTLEEYIKELENRTPITGKKFYGDGREELQDRIDKAIEYIENQNPSDIGICGNEKKYYYTLGEDNVDRLLEILKGDSYEQDNS